MFLQETGFLWFLKINKLLGQVLIVAMRIYLIFGILSIFLSIHGCNSYTTTILWEIDTVNTEEVLVTVSPAQIAVRKYDNGKQLEFTIFVLNKTEEHLFFYPFRLNISGFGNHQLPTYYNAFVSHTRDMGINLEPKGNGSIEVYVPAENLNFTLEPRLQLQILTSPIAEVTKN